MHYHSAITSTAVELYNYTFTIITISYMKNISISRKKEQTDNVKKYNKQ